MKKSIWDFWAKYYDSLWVQRFSLEPTRREILGNIPVRPGLTLLDMGCGTGQLFGDLKKHFGETEFSYRGVDRSVRMIEAARAKHPDGDFIAASSAAYSDASETYDMIICSHSFPYFPDKSTLLIKLRDMLKEGGVFIAAQAAMNNWYDAVILSLVKLTTSKTQYLSRRRMRALAEPVFRSLPQETKISPAALVPSIYLYKWTRNGRAKP